MVLILDLFESVHEEIVEFGWERDDVSWPDVYAVKVIIVAAKCNAISVRHTKSVHVVWEVAIFEKKKYK